MDFFIDTNVIIGYIFSLDPLNKYSNKLIQQKHNLLYSKHVQQEYKNKLKSKIKAYNMFFNFIQFKLDSYKKDLFNTELFQNFINQFYGKNKQFSKKDLRKTINIFLKDFELEYNCKINDLKKLFNRFTNEFNSKIFRLEDKLNQHVNVINNHDAKINKIIELKELGKSKEDVLCFFNVSHHSFDNFLKKSNVTWSNLGKYGNNTLFYYIDTMGGIKKIDTLIKKGYTKKRISDIIKVSTPTLQRYINFHKTSKKGGY